MSLRSNLKTGSRCYTDRSLVVAVMYRCRSEISVSGVDMLERVSHFIQIVSGIVLIAGVVLVVLQINQADRLADADLVSDYLSQSANQAGSAAGENPMRAFAKLCDPSEVISTEEALVLHNLFLQRLYLGYNNLAITEARDAGPEALEIAVQNFVQQMGLIIATPQGRVWFHEHVKDPELITAVQASSYYSADCSDLGVITKLISSDAMVKGKGT